MLCKLIIVVNLKTLDKSRRFIVRHKMVFFESREWPIGVHLACKISGDLPLHLRER